jgi:hypothetical protein
LTPNVLASPSQVTELTGPNSRPVVHIPLPGWVWNLERRKQWRDALNQWRQIDNLVIFVELPPASVPEAVLLGANLPNLLWLTDSGTAEAGETRTQLETLRHARCNLVGAVLNREQIRSVKRWFPRWVGALVLFAALACSHGARPASEFRRSRPCSTCSPRRSPRSPIKRPLVDRADRERDPDISETNLCFRWSTRPARAWQQHLTLGRAMC